MTLPRQILSNKGHYGGGMDIILHDTDFRLTQASAVAIGKFDGLHMGHLALLDRINKQKKNGLQAVVFTFDPAPSVFFSGRPQKLLTTRDEKREICEELGVDVLIEYPLNAVTAATPPDVFIRDVLVGQMRTEYIAAGKDVSFGDRGKGSAEMLKAFAGPMGYRTDIIDKICSHGEEVSSTLVRNYVAEGNMERTAELLGGAYRVEGHVITGRQLGRRLGMPTMNLMPPDDKLLPPNGVYYTAAVVRGRKYCSITNVGCKPTVSNERAIGVETFLYDFNEDVYGEKIKVDFLHYSRPERKFASVDELKAQMGSDIEEGRKYHGI